MQFFLFLRLYVKGEFFMTKYNWKKILSHSVEEADAIKNLSTHQQAFDNLYNFEGRIELDGEKYSVDMLKLVYLTAIENVCSPAIIDFLTSLDSQKTAEELVDEVLLDISINQHKKTRFLSEFNKAVSRKKREQSYTPAPKKLCQYVVEDALMQLDLKLRLNLVTKKIEVTGYGAKALLELSSQSNILNILPSLLLDRLRSDEIKCLGHGTSQIEKYIFNIADMNRYNPIQEMLEANENDDEGNMEVLYSILGLTDELDRTLVKKWFIQTAALAFNDFDKQISTEGVLVLQGAQGCGKTSFFRKMALKPEWFTEGAVIDVKNKDSIITAIGTWICELGEIDSTLKREQSALKAFITRPLDRIRFPYAAAESELPRATSMCGTVNPDKFLNDPTGARRYWIVSVDNIAKNTLFSLEDEQIKWIWGYAYHLYKENPASFRLSDSDLEALERRNRGYNCELKYEAEVLELLDFNLPVKDWSEITPARLAGFLGGKVTANQVGRILTKLAIDDERIGKCKDMRKRAYIIPLKKYYLSNLN